MVFIGLVCAYKRDREVKFIRIQGYIVKSVYASLDKNSARQTIHTCWDLRLGYDSIELGKYILALYRKTYILNRNAARYYITLFATYINEQKTEMLTRKDFLDEVIGVANRMSNHDEVNMIIFLLVNRLYDAEMEALRKAKDGYDVLPDDIGIRLVEVFKYIYERIDMSDINNISALDHNIIKDEYKASFANFCYMMEMEKDN